MQWKSKGEPQQTRSNFLESKCFIIEPFYVTIKKREELKEIWVARRDCAVASVALLTDVGQQMMSFFGFPNLFQKGTKFQLNLNFESAKLSFGLARGWHYNEFRNC